MSEDVPPSAGGSQAGQPRAGSRIAGYLLEEQIGRGGMAVVFRALDERLGRRVALKILAPALATDEMFRQRFIRESHAAAAVDDPHIIPVFEAGEAGEVLFIAMRYVRGGDVRTLADEHGPLSPSRVSRIILQVASALDAAHAHGLVHRDVKPANMLLDARAGGGRRDHVYLSDFGLSKASLSPSGLTGTGQFLGTLDYIAPEQIEGHLVDGRADQYALACAAFELLCGEAPYRRDEGIAVMWAKLNQRPPSLSARRDGLPQAVDAVLIRALATSPAGRFPTCRDFAEELRAALGLRPYDEEADAPGHPGAGRPQRPVHGTELASMSGDDSELELARAPSGDDSEPELASALAGDDSQPELLAGAVAGAGPPTEVTPLSASMTDSFATAGRAPGGTASFDRPAVTRGRSPWRTRASVAAAIVLLLALGGGAFKLLSTPAKHTGRRIPAAVLKAPGCSTAAGHAPALTSVSSQLVAVGANPFGVQITSNGKWVFASTPTAVVVLSKGPGLALTRRWSYTLAGDPKGEAFTSDGRYLLVATGSGIAVLSVAEAEAGASTAQVSMLSTPGLGDSGGAVEVALSPDNQFAFVTLQDRAQLSVFRLTPALQPGFTGSSFVGAVPLGLQPVGIARSPDGQWLYVTSMLASQGSSTGTVSVLDVRTAETHPQRAVVAAVNAGCQPVRVITSANGGIVWVTARASNDVLGFNAASLRSDAKHALVAKVQVGQTPIGMVLADAGQRLIIADTNTQGAPAAADNLAVVDTRAALAGRHALLGFVPTGLLPREFALVPGGATLLATDNGSSQIQVVSLTGLP